MKKGSEKEQQLLEQARVRAREGISQWQNNFDEAETDLLFLDGVGQWDEYIRQKRIDEQRPMLTINRLPHAVDTVIGSIRQNRISAKVIPTSADLKKDIPSLTTKGKFYDLADVMNGVVRHIQNKSDSQYAYHHAAKNAVESGFGFFRILTDYVNDGPYGELQHAFDQQISIERVRNPFNVIMDPYIQKADGADAEWCIIHTTIQKEEYERRYPNSSPINSLLDNDQGAKLEWWAMENSIRVAEYYYRELKEKEICLLSSGEIFEKNESLDVYLSANPEITVQQTRQQVLPQCYWLKTNGLEILEGPSMVPSQYIPVVAVYGKDLIVSGETRYRGVIRHARDPQRQYNYWRTAATEQVALDHKSPWVLTVDQVAGLESNWARANEAKKAFLAYNHIDGQPAPGRQFRAGSPAAEISQSANAVDDIKATTGLYDPSLGANSPETSGKAILARQRQGDIGTFEFHDNMARAINHCGRILLDMIPQVYDTERDIRLRFDDETEDIVRINVPELDEFGEPLMTTQGNPVLMADLSKASFDLTTKTGPSYETQRLEAQDSIMQFLERVGSHDPQAMAAIRDIVAKNMDWPGADEMYERLAKLVPAELREGEDEEEKEKEAPAPTPAEQIAMRELDVRAKEVEAEFAEAEAKVAKAMADKAQAEAEMQQAAMAGNGMDEQAIASIVAKLLAQFMAEQGVAAPLSSGNS